MEIWNREHLLPYLSFPSWQKFLLSGQALSALALFLIIKLAGEVQAWKRNRHQRFQSLLEMLTSLFKLREYKCPQQSDVKGHLYSESHSQSKSKLHVRVAIRQAES